MNENPGPALAPRVYKFSDIDQFRSWARNLEVDCTPLAHRISARQVVLNFPGYGINHMKSDPGARALIAQGIIAATWASSGKCLRFSGYHQDSDIKIGIHAAHAHRT